MKDRLRGIVQSDGTSVNEGCGQTNQPATEAEDRAMEIDCLLAEGCEELGESTCRDTELGEDGVSGAEDVSSGAKQNDVNIIRGLRVPWRRG